MYNQFQGNPGFQGTGYQYQSYGQPVYKQWLTNDELQSMIQKGGDQFSLQITEDEKNRAICNHRTADGTKDVIVPDGDDGTCRCLFCGYKFRPVSEHMTKEDIQAIVDQFVDVLQTIKVFYINFPRDAAREFFQIIPLAEKVPQLFEYAVKDYMNHANYDPYHYNARNMNSFAMFNSIIGGGVPNSNTPNPYAQQMGYQAQPQQGQAAPGFNAAYQNPGTTGFGYYGQGPMAGYGQPAGYQPNTMGYQFTPNGQAAPQQVFGQPQPQQAYQQTQQPTQATQNGSSTVPVQSTATTDGKTVDVKQTFKP